MALKIITAPAETANVNSEASVVESVDVSLLVRLRGEEDLVRGLLVDEDRFLLVVVVAGFLELSRELVFVGDRLIGPRERVLWSADIAAQVVVMPVVVVFSFGDDVVSPAAAKGLWASDMTWSGTKCKVSN